MIHSPLHPPLEFHGKTRDPTFTKMDFISPWEEIVNVRGKNSCFETFKIQNYYKTNVTILRDNYINQDELPQADEA